MLFFMIHIPDQGILSLPPKKERKSYRFIILIRRGLDLTIE